MSNLSTKDIKTGGDGVSKTLEPGINTCKINNITLEEFKFKEGALNVMLHLEGEDLGSSFEGFFINKDKPEAGRHKGKVGVVKLTEWAFADGETKSKVPVSRDQELLKSLKQLCVSLGCLKWLEDQDGKHANVQSLFTAFAKDKPFGNTFFRFCIGGKEYVNRGGYTAHELFLPKYSKEGVPVERDDVQMSKLLKFNADTQIRKKKAESIETFGSTASQSGSDFEL